MSVQSTPVDAAAIIANIDTMLDLQLQYTDIMQKRILDDVLTLAGDLERVAKRIRDDAAGLKAKADSSSPDFQTLGEATVRRLRSISDVSMSGGLEANVRDLGRCHSTIQSLNSIKANS